MPTLRSAAHLRLMRELLAIDLRRRQPLGHVLVHGLHEFEHVLAQNRIGLGVHERSAAVERTDGRAVFVYQLVVDASLQSALGVLHVDSRERVRTVEDQPDLVLRVAEVADGLEDETDVLQARQIGRHHDEDEVGDVHDTEVDFVESLVYVEHDVIELVGELRDYFGQVFAGHELGRFRRRGGEQQAYPRLVLDQDLADEFDVERPGRREFDDALAVQAQVQEHAVVAQLQAPLYQADSLPQLLVKGDSRIDGDRGRSDATLGPIEEHNPRGFPAPGRGRGKGPASREWRVRGRETRQQAAHARH